ncbi:hypothetical protein [Aeromonas caviae]|uniref:hypothetical protein n=1 Tax=Aeromonas caviae TaxID=648 RepID=UPI001F4EEE47
MVSAVGRHELCLPAHHPGPHRAHPGKRRPGPAATLNCRRYEPLGEGIREAVTLLNALIAEPDAPAHPPVPIARRQDARLLIQVDKDQMSARAQITADWGGQP